MTLYEKLMAFANDPAATEEERRSYREKAEQIRDKDAPFCAAAIARYLGGPKTQWRGVWKDWQRSSTESSYCAVRPVNNPGYTHVDVDGIPYRFEGGRPVSQIADEVMRKVFG
jgi:hypothetical protein